jgi:muramoyltetrapeptide carboxypeptidase
MLASKDFHQMRSDDEQALLNLIKGGSAPVRYREGAIKWLTVPGDFAVTASLSGGNLAVICSMIGTPWQLDFSGKLLFLEEIGESWCKIERMLQHLLLSGALKQCKGIVLGEFSNCFDTSPKGLKNKVGDDYGALRTAFNPAQAFEKVFSNLSTQLDVPIGYGLAVGHCSENAPLALFKNYRLSTEQGLELLNDKVTVAEFL